MVDHQSSWFGRAQTRALIEVEQRLGLEPKKAKIVFIGLVILVLVSIVNVSTMMLADDGSEFVSQSGFSSAMTDGESSSSASASGGSSNLFADDGGDDEEEGDQGGDGGGDGDGDDEEEGEQGGHSSASRSSAVEDDDDAEAEPFKAKQLKLFQDKDKSLMKFFTKHRKDSEIAAHFQTLEDTYKELKLMRTISIGSTYEKKTIIAYAIGKGKSGRGILVHATERGDEWAGNMGLAYFATRLLQKYALTPAVTKVVHQLTIYLIPVVNPDGLSYALSSSSKTHREWYMNRALNADKKHGVDVSHDFQAASQLETQAVQAFAKKNADNIHAFANVRCCGGAVSIPQPALCPNSESQKDVASRVAAAMGKTGSYRYTTRFTDAEATTSTVYAFNSLNVGLTMTLDAHPATSVSSPGDVKSSDILATAQNITMGLMEVAKFVAVDFTRAKVSLGGGGQAPCGASKGGSSKKRSAASDDDDESAGEDDEDRGGDDDGEDRHGGDAEDDGEGGEPAAPPPREIDDRDHANAFEHARQGSVEATDELDMSLKHVTPQGIRRPAFGLSVPTDPESGDTFLYFAYGPDMLYDVLLKAGLTSAWKVVNARLSGYTYDYTYHSNKKWKSGVADIVKYSHGTVYGVVWRLDRLHMQTLLTWQSASTPTSPLAQKMVTVQDLEGNSYNCITFYVVKKMKGEDVLGKYHRFNPSRQYRNCVIKGAKANHLPYDYVEHKLKSRALGPLFTDKVGTTGHRNVLIGQVCDPIE